MKDSLFLQACRGEQTERPPIWLMRQAGRYLPEYRELRKGMTMLEAVSNPDVAVEATLQPIRRFGFDAAILFSDLTVPFTPMGAPFEIKEGVGPVVENPMRSSADFERLSLFDPNDGLPFVMETIRRLKQELPVPLIGFTGAPFTLASYLIEGGPSRDLKRTKAMMLGEPKLWARLMELLAEVVARYLTAQIEAGADAVQLFDSWVGNLSPEAYRRHLLPYMPTIFERISGAPVIHFGTGNPLLLPVMREAGGTVIGVDFRTTLSQAAQMVPGVPLQGNFDPALLFSNPDTIRREASAIVAEGRSLPGHIFNLGHGILPETPLGHVEALVETVKEWKDA
ncbi:MAG: uroporphyrinogen decarboxylase [Armatimonadetes bacterium]|nr:uroporphyrinogen decarboxylase [Armatimonadota bacterium]